MTEPTGEKWEVWRDYDKMKVAVQEEGREPRFLTPEDARDIVSTARKRLEAAGIEEDGQTKNFHNDILEYADELEAKKNNTDN